MQTLSIVFEYNGSDIITVVYKEPFPVSQLLSTAQEVAYNKETDISDITIRFVLKGETHGCGTKAQATD